MNTHHAIVIGAGLGGIATALRLSRQGLRITVLEKTDQLGGRNRAWKHGDYQFDGGPTLLMMLDPFRKLFEDAGTRIEDHLDLELLDPSYRVFWADGSRLDATANTALMMRRISELADQNEAWNYPRLLGDLTAMYKDSIPHFVRKNFYGPQTFFGMKQLGMVARHKMLANLAKRVDRYFTDPRLRMLFSFQTMYLGLSPFSSPWVYGVLTYMEYGEGIWYSKGGVPKVCEAAAKLAEASGAEFRTNAPVKQILIENGRATGVELESGERLSADLVISNADLPYACEKLLPERHRPAQAKLDRLEHSCSAFMMYVGYRGELPTMLHHNVFFGADFRRNLDDIFVHKRMPNDPAFYACINAKSDPDHAPKGCSNLYVLVPVPNLAHPFGEADAGAVKEHVSSRLEREAGLDRTLIEFVDTYTPHDWQTDLNLNRGAAFGLSHEFRQSAYFRPANKLKGVEGVYFVGASTVPGNGLPMVLISAELMEERLRKEGRLPATALPLREAAPHHG